MQIEFKDETNSVSEEYIKTIHDLLRFAAKQEKVPEHAEVSISFVDNKTIRTLNKSYREIDEATDVISFALQDEVYGEQAIITDESLPLVLGDIVISVEKAQEQADSYQHSLNREYGFLALHGFLHLLGYDHETEEDEQEMFTKQEEVLNAFGLSRE